MGEESVAVRQVVKAGSHYEVLGVPGNASAPAIRRAYRDLALRLHPDKCGAPGAEEAFKRVAAAFEVLGSGDARGEYDAAILRADPRQGAHQQQQQQDQQRGDPGGAGTGWGGRAAQAEPAMARGRPRPSPSPPPWEAPRGGEGGGGAFSSHRLVGEWVPPADPSWVSRAGAGGGRRSVELPPGFEPKGDVWGGAGGGGIVDLDPRWELGAAVPPPRSRSRAGLHEGRESPGPRGLGGRGEGERGPSPGPGRRRAAPTPPPASHFEVPPRNPRRGPGGGRAGGRGEEGSAPAAAKVVAPPQPSWKRRQREVEKVAAERRQADRQAESQGRWRERLAERSGGRDGGAAEDSGGGAEERPGGWRERLAQRHAR